MKEKFLLTTERVILRELQEADNLDWLEIFNSNNVAKYLVKIDNIQSINKLISKKINKYKDTLGGSFSVVQKETLKVIGNVELKVDAEKMSAEISYVFNDKYWNNGYCTEAVTAVFDYAFDKLKLAKIEADCIADNFASIHILQDKLNMRLIREEISAKDTKKYKFFEITNAEWRNKKI